MPLWAVAFDEQAGGEGATEMSNVGMDLSPARVRSRQKQTVWLTRRGWTAREIARELGVTMRTVERYRRQARAGERR